MSSQIVAPRGTQDILPPSSARWYALESRMHELATRFGYGEVRTPMFESTELFVRGVGETSDIVEKEMYTFIDKGGRSMTLRPEWTAPVMRAALEHSLFAQGPGRWFYIGPIFRYERPQKGRYRQSHQFGVEYVGFAGAEADFEVIALAWELVRGHNIDDAVLNLNSIGDEACRPRYREALIAHFRPHIAALSEDSRRRLERNPLRLLDSKDARDRPYIETAPTLESMLCDACREHFAEVRAYLDASKIPYAINPRIVRGIDYYTRTVFEITSDALGAQSTLCGGGRYDGLVEALGGPRMPAMGFALGIERFLTVLEAAHGASAPARRGVQLIALGAQARALFVALAQTLRQRLAAPTYIDYEERKLLAHLKIADRNAARFALILGSDELASGELILRDLETRTDRSIAFDSPEELIEALGEAGLP